MLNFDQILYVKAFDSPHLPFYCPKVDQTFGFIPLCFP